MAVLSTEHRQGDLVYLERVCADLDAICDFFTPLRGWDYIPGMVGPHYIATVGGVQCAGLAHTITRADGVPVSWLPYLAVDDCDRSCQVIVDNGGTATVDDVIRHIVARVLDQCGIENDLTVRWGVTRRLHMDPAPLDIYTGRESSLVSEE